MAADIEEISEKIYQATSRPNSPISPLVANPSQPSIHGSGSLKSNQGSMFLNTGPYPSPFSMNTPYATPNQANMNGNGNMNQPNGNAYPSNGNAYQPNANAYPSNANAYQPNANAYQPNANAHSSNANLNNPSPTISAKLNMTHSPMASPIQVPQQNFLKPLVIGQ